MRVTEAQRVTRLWLWLVPVVCLLGCAKPQPQALRLCPRPNRPRASSSSPPMAMTNGPVVCPRQTGTGTDGPFATLPGALKTIRGLRQQHDSAAGRSPTVFVGGGFYFAEGADRVDTGGFRPCACRLSRREACLERRAPHYRLEGSHCPRQEAVGRRYSCGARRQMVFPGAMGQWPAGHPRPAPQAGLPRHRGLGGQGARVDARPHPLPLPRG